MRKYKTGKIFSFPMKMFFGILSADKETHKKDDDNSRRNNNWIVWDLKRKTREIEKRRKEETESCTEIRKQ